MHQPIEAVARKECTTLHQDNTIGKALEIIRFEVSDQMIVYFYIVDDENRLVGIVPTRRLLTYPLDKRLSEVMIRKEIAHSSSETILAAHELLMRHKLLALQLVDEEKRIVSVIDISMLSNMRFELDKQLQVNAQPKHQRQKKGQYKAMSQCHLE